MAIGSAAAAAMPAHHRPFFRSLYFQVLTAIALGVLLGHFYPQLGEQMKPFGDAFIKAIKMIIAPIIFCTVVHGIASMQDMKKVGRVGLKALIYFEVLTTLALIVGLIVANTLQPGAGMNIDASTIDTRSIQGFVTKSKEQSTVQFLMDIIPNTVVGAFAQGEILQVLFFAVLFAFGLQMLGERGQVLLGVIDQASHALFAVVGIIMKAAPLGAFGAMAFTIGKYGVATLVSLAHLMIAFYTTCIIFILFVLGAVAWLAGFNILKFIRYIKEELLIVLGTSSSESVLPRMIAKMENLGCETVGGRPRDPDRLLLQPRRHLHLSHHGRAVPGAGDRNGAQLRPAARHHRHPALDFEGRRRRHRLGLHRAGGDLVLGRHHSGRQHRAHPRRRPLHVGGARAHQPDRQRRRHCRRLALGGRARRREDAPASRPGDRGRSGHAGGGHGRGRDQGRRRAPPGDVLRGPRR